MIGHLNNDYATFLSPDTVVNTLGNDQKSTQQYIGDPQNLNSFNYSRNDPINKSDPSGKCFGPALIICAYALEAAGTAMTGYSIYNVANHYYNETQNQLSTLDYLSAVPGVAVAKVGSYVIKGGEAATGAMKYLDIVKNFGKSQEKIL
jgi:hypothetical protein